MHLAVVRYSHRLCNVVAFQTFLTQHGLPIPSDVGGQQAGDGSSEHSGDASGRRHHARLRLSVAGGIAQNKTAFYSQQVCMLHFDVKTEKMAWRDDAARRSYRK